MEHVNVLFTSPEAVPFIKTGGLADVAGMLPRVLAEMGHAVTVALPFYSLIPDQLLVSASPEAEFEIKINDRVEPVTIVSMASSHPGLNYLFVGNDHFFDREALYVDPETGLDYTDNDERFSFFCRAVLEYLRRSGTAPDIIHANDWQSGLLPAYLGTVLKDDPFFAATRSVYTIHNLAYQGTFPSESFVTFGFPKELYYPTGPFEFYGKVNIMKAAITYADILNTVSERYAVEIQSSDEYGCGLEGVLRTRNEDLYGIINGVDYDEWSPQKDRYLPYRYSPANLAGKKKVKVELINRLGLPFREHAPLIGIISRLADQKGFDLIALCAEEIFGLDIQMVLLGTGDRKYHDLFRKLETRFPDKLKALLTYDNEMAHWIEAGADMYLMPSRYEPCGLNQLYSLKYGTPPIVRATGGLADTIIDVDSEKGLGTGFVFTKYDPEAMLAAIKRAVALFPKKRMWRRVMKEGMRQDYSWHASAAQYMKLYEKALTS